MSRCKRKCRQFNENNICLVFLSLNRQHLNLEQNKKKRHHQRHSHSHTSRFCSLNRIFCDIDFRAAAPQPFTSGFSVGRPFGNVFSWHSSSVDDPSSDSDEHDELKSPLVYKRFIILSGFNLLLLFLLDLFRFRFLLFFFFIFVWFWMFAFSANANQSHFDIQLIESTIYFIYRHKFLYLLLRCIFQRIKLFLRCRIKRRKKREKKIIEKKDN